jgi:hypothetical protein
MWAIPGARRAFILVVTCVATAANGLAGDQDFYQAYYLQHSKGDVEGAAKLYQKVADDRGADDLLRTEARRRLAECGEELAAADFTRLMPRNAWAYVEINRPGDQLLSLVRQLGLLNDPDAERGGKNAERKFGISPVVIQELLGMRGVAAAVTGFDPAMQAPKGVAVFHPGRLEVIRGILETALPVGGEITQSIGGFETYRIENMVFVTLTKRLVIVSMDRAEIEGVVDRLTGADKDSLADNDDLADALKLRNDGLLFFCVNAKPIMPFLKMGVAAAGTQSREVAMAQALLDIDSLRSVVGQAGVSDDGLYLDVAINLDKGHHNLVYNFLRMPAVERETLRSIPRGSAAFIAAALNEADSRFDTRRGTNGDHDADEPQIVTAMDIGREVFGNIVSFGAFVLPPEGELARAGGEPIPDAAVVMTVNNPAKSEALWTQMLGIASMASGEGSMEGSVGEIDGVQVRGFALPEVTIFVAVSGNDVLVSPSKTAISRAIAARHSGQSVLDDPAFGPSLERFGEHTTLLAASHPLRCTQIARLYMSPREFAEIEPYIGLLSETVCTTTLNHSAETFHISSTVTGIPDVSGLVTQLVSDLKAGREPFQHAAHVPTPAQRAEAPRQVEAPRLREQRARAARRAERTAVAEEPRAEPRKAETRVEAAEETADADTLQADFEEAVEKGDREAAELIGARLLKAFGDEADAMNQFAWGLLTEDRFGGQYAKLALKVSQRSNVLTHQSNWFYVDTLAHAYFALGDLKEAIRLERRAVELAAGDRRADEARQALERFEKALRSKDGEKGR